MKPLRIADDIVPIGKFKREAPQWMKRIASSGQPLVITQNGKPAAVMLSPEEYDRIAERQRFLESVAAGLSDADAGRVMATEELRSRLGIDGDMSNRA